jgi:lipopolysaccharide export LptBFGC system permease protein LptF
MDIGTAETLARRSEMLDVLIVAGLTGLVSATVALWAQRRAMIHQRVFAGLVSLAVTVILFSLMGWAAAALAIAPFVLTWVFVGAFAFLFALRLYRELRSLPTID